MQQILRFNDLFKHVKKHACYQFFLITVSFISVVMMLEEPKFKFKMVVIFAGYETDIDLLMKANVGLASRVTEKLHFANFSCDDSCLLFKKKVAQDGVLSLSDKSCTALRDLMNRLIAAPNFANGRDVDTWQLSVFKAVSSRFSKHPLVRPLIWLLSQKI